MTSAQFTSLPLSKITVVREERQRRELNDIDSLAQSLQTVGLIHPIVVTREGVLIAGERRLTAAKQLGWDSITVQFAEDLPKEELHLIELEENTKRLDLSWQERNDAVATYHELKLSLDPEWNARKTADALGLVSAAISKHLAVRHHMSDPAIATAPTFKTALSIVERREARAKAATVKAVGKVMTPMATLEPEEEAEPEEVEIPLINADFIEWARGYSGPAFTFLHCDFPYGIGANTAPKTAAGAYNTTAAVRLGGYDDSEETYWNLLDALEDLPIAPTAHMMFWFSMNYYETTKKRLELQGWIVDPFPLIWVKSDNAGVLPDPSRGGRRTYETAFHCMRGNAKIVKAVALGYSGPTGRSERIHMSEKPQPMLEHFLRMYVDPYTTMLDPTCGSGNAVRVAQRLGAAKALGIEKDSEFYARAVEAWTED